MFVRILVMLVALGLFSPQVFAHGGGTNASGCHTNHSTGDYHCHTPKTPAPSQVTYCHVVNGEYRCGYAYSTCTSLVSQYGGYCVIQ